MSFDEPPAGGPPKALCCSKLGENEQLQVDATDHHTASFFKHWIYTDGKRIRNTVYITP
jgi:hypothetical protein